MPTKEPIKKPKRLNAVQQHLNQVVWFGGQPLRRGDVMLYLEEVAKTYDAKNWLRIRDAGMLGNYQFNEKHGYPPEGTEPLSLAEFKKVIGEEEEVVELQPVSKTQYRATGKGGSRSNGKGKRGTGRTDTSLGSMR